MRIRPPPSARAAVRRVPRAALLGALLAVATTARAVAPSPPSDGSAEPPPVVPPKLSSDARVPYPEGGKGNATVLLELLVDRAGTVKEAHPVSGEPPFSGQAARFALGFRFDPATRGDTTISARIRFVVRFVAEDAKPVEVAPAPAESSTPDGKVEPKGGVEVKVESARPDASVSRYGHAEVRQLPGAFGDPYRAIEAMPGVVPIVSGLPYFFVRGAPPGNVGYFVDGIRVPLLYHVGAGPAVIHPALIDNVALYSGSYPARYGRFAGGIVTGETRAPATEPHGEAGIRLVDAGGLVEAPFFGNAVTGLVSGRFGYPGVVLRAFAPDAILQYWDYQARAQVKLGQNDTASVFALGAYDFLGTRREDGSTDVAFGTEFHRMDLRYDHRYSENTDVRVATTVGFDRSRANDGIFVIDRMVGSRIELRHAAAPTTTFRAGADVMLDVYDVNVPTDDQDAQALARLIPARRDVTTGAWTELSIQATPRIHITPGLRADVFVYGGRAAVGVDPRIAAEFQVSKDIRLLHSLGIAHQTPSFLVPLPGLQFGKGVLQTSLLHSFGVETKLPQELVGTFTVFHNAVFDLTDALGTAGRSNDLANETSIETDLATRSLGSTVGLEVHVRRALTHRLGGFLAYTLSRSTRSGGTRGTYPSNYDRTHVLQVGVSLDLGKRWRGGARGMVYTGSPVIDRRAGEPERLPAFYRLDVRLEKRWPLGKRGYWAFVVDILNATLTKEYVDATQPIGPVTVPSIGVEAAF